MFHRQAMVATQWVNRTSDVQCTVVSVLRNSINTNTNANANANANANI